MNITAQNSSDILKEIEDRFYDIPFDNSQFQNDNFIINSALTPERAYRSAGLRLQSRLNSLKAVSFTHRKNEVKVKQLKRKLENETDDLEQELIRIEIEEIQSDNSFTNKLINDAIVESQQLYNFIQSCPAYTREQFENAEQLHFQNKLIEDASGITGALKALSDMGIDIVKLQSGSIEYKNDKQLKEIGR